MKKVAANRPTSTIDFSSDWMASKRNGAARSKRGENAGKGHQEKNVFPAVMCPDDAGKCPAARSAEQHPGSENGLRECAALLEESAGNHGLRGGSICGFTQADHCSRYKEQKKCRYQAAGERSRTPKENADADDDLAAEAIRKESKRNAPYSKNSQGPGMQAAELGVRGVEIVPQQRD